MNHTKKFTRDDGTVVTILIGLDNDRAGSGFFIEGVYVAKSSRSKPIAVRNIDDHVYRCLPTGTGARLDYWQKKYMELVTPSEVLAAKLEFWEKIKPTQ